MEGSVVINKVAELEWGHGFNAATTASTATSWPAGVIDPVKVTAAPWSTPRRSRGWC